MAETKQKDRFEVGYGKPPRHSRFAPGRSGNPRGRQKGVRNLASDVKRILEVPVKLTDQGKARRVSTQEAMLLRLREKALKGDARALDRLLALAGTYNVADGGSAIDQAMSAEDQAIGGARERLAQLLAAEDDASEAGEGIVTSRANQRLSPICTKSR